MKTLKILSKLLAVLLLFTCYTAMAQKSEAPEHKKTETEMKTYLIEREIPDAGKFTPADLKKVSQTSCTVLKEMGTGIEWIHSYVTGNKVYCIYKAENAALLKEHAKKAGFPANAINEIATTISPATAEQ